MYQKNINKDWKLLQINSFLYLCQLQMKLLQKQLHKIAKDAQK